MAAFSVGVSGLQAANRSLETIGNNVANASTVGFKQSRVEFADIYAKGGLMSGQAQPGHGVKVADISQQFTQGGTSFTQNSLDMAIDGNGFFIVKNNGMDTYTRAGTFGMDKSGYVVTNEGNRVQGFPASVNGDSIQVGAISDLYIPVANIEPKATSAVDISFNLDSRKEPPSNYVFDENDSDTYTHLYPAVIYDSLGNSHTLTQYFVKQPPYQPEYGDQSRALQAMIGFARFGNNVLDDTQGGKGFVGDSNQNAALTLDSDITAILSKGGFNGVTVNADGSGSFNTSVYGDTDGNAATNDPIANADYDDLSATDAQRAAQLQNIHDTLKNLISSESGRTKEYYQAAYDSLTDYLPSLTSNSVGGADKEVFDGAIAALEGSSSLSGKNIAYGNIDAISGIARSKLLNAATVTDPLKESIKANNVDPAGFTGGPADVEAFVADMKSALTALMNGTVMPAATSTLWDNNSDFFINPNPTAEEQGTYKLALDALNELTVNYDEGGAVSASAVVDTLSALESESSDNRWQMHAFVDGERVTDGNTNSPDYFSFNFTEFGALAEPLPKITIKDWTPRDTGLNQNGSKDPQEFTIDLAGTTQFAGAFGATALKQDGYATGELAGIDVDKTGVMNARYTNGTTRLVGQVAIATFRNEQGLTPIGGTAWRQSNDSGDPVVNAPGVSVAGNIQSKALEDSNVDLSQELVKMILAQRDYQANAKTIQTADTVTQTIINLR
ncbi:Flagellar basal body protein FlaE [Oceanospirillum multiglobuliferum]|uniref:Flagellar hook protein FlgE n=1 Tax=Oceanospirillum multiglobuliferum TaxID=64969 RepID=A0A1T4RJ97_9GAMM|nr:flagellar hook-basal body complex protein [Oceanospirillum multiglobuliferum]OPX54818.1 hypothetical protein BTE48_12405 [Oceanospirillum multiglobuliferum]SKA16055.1 Flagellar basal body protein FlaE [Oceanospirillum multiglobuliferum]